MSFTKQFLAEVRQITAQLNEAASQLGTADDTVSALCKLTPTERVFLDQGVPLLPSLAAARGETYLALGTAKLALRGVMAKEGGDPMQRPAMAAVVACFQRAADAVRRRAEAGDLACERMLDQAAGAVARFKQQAARS